MLKRTLSAIAAAALAAGTVAIATPAVAAQAQDGITIAYGDLDLSTDAGKARLDRRVRQAARSFCGDVPLQNIGQRTAVLACHSEVAAAAEEDLRTAMAAKATSVRLALRNR